MPIYFPTVNTTSCASMVLIIGLKNQRLQQRHFHRSETTVRCVGPIKVKGAGHWVKKKCWGGAKLLVCFDGTIYWFQIYETAPVVMVFLLQATATLLVL